MPLQEFCVCPVAGVFQEDPEVELIAFEKLISIERAFKWEAVGNQWLDIESTVGHHVQHCFKIPLCGPADVRIGVVMPTLFVCRVVSAGPVRAGNLEAQFFLVEVVAGEFETSNADKNDAAAFAAHMRSLMDRLIALRGGGDDYTIDSPAPRQSFSRS